MRAVRIFFEKSGPARYISHLDLMRCFERTMRRAELPFWFTEGFNPRPFLTFALPLSLGTAGMKEIVDIRLVEDMPLDEVKNRLNGCLPEGMRVLRCADPVKKPKEIAASRYEITITGAGESSSVAAALTLFLSAGSITAKKKNKKKQLVEMEIKPMVHKWSVAAEGDSVKLDIVLASGCTDNCNPALVLDAFRESKGATDMRCEIVRTEILDGDMKPFV